MRSVMDFITRRYPGVRATKTPEEIVDWLRAFHTRWPSDFTPDGPSSI